MGPSHYTACAGLVYIVARLQLEICVLHVREARSGVFSDIIIAMYRGRTPEGELCLVHGPE